MEIKEMEAETVEDFLRFLYTGDVPDGTNVIKLFTIAAKLEVPGLKSICEDRILPIIDESNVQQVLAFAIIHE